MFRPRPREKIMGTPMGTEGSFSPRNWQNVQDENKIISDAEICIRLPHSKSKNHKIVFHFFIVAEASAMRKLESSQICFCVSILKLQRTQKSIRYFFRISNTNLNIAYIS